MDTSNYFYLIAIIYLHNFLCLFGGVLWHINRFRLFNAKFFQNTHTYISYIYDCKRQWVKLF